MGVLVEIDKTGDTRLMWDKDNPAEVKRARERFGELKAKGLMGYGDDGKGNRLEVMHTFDPDAERVTFEHSRVVGG